MELLADTLRAIQPLDAAAMETMRDRQKTLLKPEGSLGTLEELSIQFAGITGRTEELSTHPRLHYVFSSDHGVYAAGVCSSPQSFTQALTDIYRTGRGGAINVLCDWADVELKVLELGTTENLLERPAMTPDRARETVELGIRLALDAGKAGYKLLSAGEVGMGNTTPAAACIMAALNSRDPLLVGRGAGLTDEGLENKRRVILAALEKHDPDPSNPLEILSCVGGLDIAAMTGFYLGAAAARVPVVLDGVISLAAALLAWKLAPLSRDYMIPSHESMEPAYRAAAAAMGLTPPLRLNMRLGEGTGCPLLMRLLDAALAIPRRMATFADLE